MYNSSDNSFHRGKFVLLIDKLHIVLINRVISDLSETPRIKMIIS